MYGLPNIHKAQPILFRPILSMVSSAVHEMARWLNELLQPVLKQYSSHLVSVSFDFCEVLHEFGSPDEASFMCSFDVKSLFTNVPIDETIDICLNAFYRTDEIETPTIEEKLLKKLLVKCTRDVEFSFNRIFRQVDGVAMGSPIYSVIANIFMENLEGKAFASCSMTPRLWRRFVDDIISVVPKSCGELLLQQLNKQHPRIKFTMEEEQEGSLPFMDVCFARKSDGRLARQMY